MSVMWIPKRLVEISLVNTAAESGATFSCHCEIEYDSRIEAAAREVLANGARVVMLTGPSASGKTATANRLCTAIRANGKQSVVISLDNFYKNLDEYPHLPDGTKDYENITALDVAGINTCLKSIVNTGSAQVPVFDFLTEQRKEEYMHFELGDGVAIVEGIHALNPELIKTIADGSVYKIYAGLREEYSFLGQRSIATRDIRLARRLVRDNKFRGHSLEKTLGMWDRVCAGEDKYIKVFKPSADLLLDTSLSYEICCLTPFVTSFNGALAEDSPHNSKLNSLIHRFKACSRLSDKLIPTHSILREFIG